MHSDWDINMLCSIGLQPSGNTHSGLLGEQHLVLQLIAFKKHTLAVARLYYLNMVAVINAQFTPVLLLPLRVQIHDHRKRPALVVSKLIEVFFVKTTLCIQRIMEFVTGDTRIAGTV